MAMVLTKKSACILLVLLCAAWLSSARLSPTGATDFEISDRKASIDAASATKSTRVKIIADQGNLNKPNAMQLVKKSGKFKPASSVSVRSRLLDEDSGFVAFSADYHRPSHHPPKNNK